MLTRGSRFYFATSFATYLVGVLYGVLTQTFDVGVKNLLLGDGAVNAVLGPLTFGYKGGVGEHVGYALLMLFAAGCVLFGAMAVAFRDVDVDAVVEQDPDAGAVQPTPVTSNVWPAVGGVSLAVAALGAAVDPLIMWIGIAGVVVATVEWSVAAWSESLSSDHRAQAIARRRLMLPVEVPVGGALLLGVVAISFSRLLLAVESNVAITVTLALAALAFVGVVLLARAESVRKPVAVGAVCAVAVLVLATGVIGAALGPAEVHKVNSQAELEKAHSEEEG